MNAALATRMSNLDSLSMKFVQKLLTDSKSAKSQTITSMSLFPVSAEKKNTTMFFPVTAKPGIC